jgi:hypothetical protein
MTSKSLLSALIIATAGLGSKAFLNYLCADVKVVGLPRLLNELDRVRTRKGRGVLTGWYITFRANAKFTNFFIVSNHISVFVIMLWFPRL